MKKQSLNYKQFADDFRRVVANGIRIYFEAERQTPLKIVPKAWIVVEYPGKPPKKSQELYDQNSRKAENKIKELYRYIAARL